MRSVVNVQVLILSALVLFATSLVNTGEHGEALIQRSSSASSDDIAGAAEELNLQLAIDAEFAEISRSHGHWEKPTPRHDTSRRAAAFAQLSKASSDDNSGAMQDLDLQHAINAELADMSRSHGQWTKVAHELHRGVSEGTAVAGGHRAAALLQSGHNAKGDSERSQVAKDLDLQHAIDAELAEMSQSHGQWKKPQPLPDVPAALLQAGHHQPDGDADRSLEARLTTFESRTAPQPRVATAEALQSSGVKPSNVPHATVGAAVHVEGIVQKAQVTQPDVHPSLLAKVQGRDNLETWTSARFIFWRNLHVSQYFVKCFISVLIWASLTMFIGCFYHHEKLHPPKMDPEGVNVSLHDRERLDRQRWRFGLFECTEVPSLCLISFFCAPIRWADTMRMAGFMNFFSALALVVVSTVLGSLTLGAGFLFLLGICVRFRLHMRKQFDIRDGFCGVYADVLAYIFCPWCAIVQEARQIEEAYLARHASVRGEYTMAHLKNALKV